MRLLNHAALQKVWELTMFNFLKFGDSNIKTPHNHLFQAIMERKSFCKRKMGGSNIQYSTRNIQG